MNTLGCDPGLSGALALLDPDAKLLELVDMPTLTVQASRRVIHTTRLVDVLVHLRMEYGDYRAVIEQGGTRPGQHAASGLKTGFGIGVLVGAVAAQRTPFEMVIPRTWQKAVLPPGEPGTSKARALLKASELWPEADLGKRKTSDRSDALCIALYGVRFFGSRN